MIMFVYIKSSDFTKIIFTMSQGHFGEHFQDYVIYRIKL